jgi:molecular chaperone DnaK
MSRLTIDFGIDLGTTNSAISIAQGGGVETIRNGGSEITPSLVAMDTRGAKRVGMGAMNMYRRPSSATSVHAEFKRVMGQRVHREFKAAGLKMTPEELSAEVLMELRRACAARFGSEPEAAVITVPAMFELPQNEATANAAKLAGFAHSQLLQEPVAAAVAYGFSTDVERAYWLVYDYGGGTFDASIVSVRDGQLSVIKHAGDNYLGGADLDWKIVEEILVPPLRAQYEFSSLSRDGSASDLDQGRMLVLKNLAESIKKELTGNTTAHWEEGALLEDDDGEPVDVVGALDRARFEALAAPAVDRSVSIVEQLIADSGIPRDKIDKLLLVGGSTFIPLVRQRLAALGIPLGLELDPMTVVSRGAAIFASSQRMPRVLMRAAPAAAGTATISLEYEPVTKDQEPMVGGRVEVDNAVPPAGTTVELSREDGGWSSGEIPLDSKGMFFTAAKIREKGQTTVQISVRVSGKDVPCQPTSIAITSGLQVGNARLPAGVGIATADGNCPILHAGGVPLPRSEEIWKGKFTRSLRRGSDESLRIPIMSGDDPIAEHNRCGTVITIKGTDISRDVPAGADVEIGISLDAAGVPAVRVFVPLLDETFETAEPMRLEYEPADIIRERKAALEKRLEKIEEDADSSSLDDVSADAMALRLSKDMDAIDSLANKADGDGVAAGQATHLIAEISKKASAIESRVALPAATAEFNSTLDDARKGVTQYGKPDERKIVEELAREGNKAIQAKDVAGLRHCTEQLAAIVRQFLARDPGFWIGFLHYLGSRQSSFTDQAAGRRLLAEGAQAAQRRDIESVQSVVQQLMGLLPPQEAEAAASRLKSHVVNA